MSKPGQKTKEIQIDDLLIESANEYLAHLPKSAQEVIEKWAWIGKAVAEQLTEEELLNLQLRNEEIEMQVVPKK